MAGRCILDWVKKWKGLGGNWSVDRQTLKAHDGSAVPSKPWGETMHVKRYWRPLIISASLLAGLGLIPAANAIADDARDARAVVRDVNGAFLGVVTLTPAGGKLVVTGRLNGLTQGFHGFHVHSVGKCEPAAIDPATG